jgi:hypothetical protein
MGEASVHKKLRSSEMGAQEITSLLRWLASSRRVSASTQNQALSAILFLCRERSHCGLRSDVDDAECAVKAELKTQACLHASPGKR